MHRISSFIVKRNFSIETASTIFALSSGQGKCGVAVIRVSGPKASDAILKMTKRQDLPKPRTAVLHHIKDPITHEEIDKGLVLWFPGPNSFTGEDSCEFQIHGGPAVVSSTLSALSKLPNFRPAEPGEFTKSAFHSGKLDLTEVEGLGDLIHAETELQRRQALLQMEGTLSKLYCDWRSRLMKNLAHVEAYIDFGEDDNIESNILEVVNNELLSLIEEMNQHVKDGRCGQRLRDGVRAVVVGQPNVGKSSFFNSLCQKPAAIVTSIPGTTRDIIECNININGYPLILIDTAGIRKQTSDVVEKEGIIRALETARGADLLLLLLDATALTHLLPNDFNVTKLINYNIKMLDLEDTLNLSKGENYLNSKLLVVFNKIDLLTEKDKLHLQKAIKNFENLICLSCKTEEGFENLLNILSHELKFLCGNPSRENPSLTRARHMFHLTESIKNLKEYFIFINENNVALAAHHIQTSLRHLGKIVGAVSSEDILNIIFKDFCIGK